MSRKTIFANDEIYHVFNRGVDKRIIFESSEDSDRFLQDMIAFNTEHPIGSLFVLNRGKSSGRTATNTEDKPLVEIMAFCLNPNHFHILLKQILDGGVSEFMKRLSGGYTWYFNHKYERTGSLFQGKFKAVHVDSNEYLLHLSAYINLNDKVHNCSGPTAAVIRSSWEEYKKGIGFCKKTDVLGQFRNPEEYLEFSENSLKGTKERRGILSSEYLLEE